ncbi:MAG: hypothetical protein AAB941_00925 [Patescibacteria group bacterium]
MNLLTPLLSIIILVSINIILSHRGKKLYWLYEASHFVGGFILAALFLNFLDKKPVLLTVLMFSILWEIYELIINRNEKAKKFLEKNFKYHITPSSFSDTALDLLLGVLGAMFYLYLF